MLILIFLLIKLKERTRLHVFNESDSEQTHFSLKPLRVMADISSQRA
jgi:hypothetical protein